MTSLLGPEAMSQGVLCGSSCSCHDCKAVWALGMRTCNRLLIASPSEPFARVLVSWSSTFLCFLMQFCSCFGVSCAFKPFTA